MVLPVQSLPGAIPANGNNKKNKRGNNSSNQKGATEAMTGAVQVNLIMDPTMFGGGVEREEEEESSEEEGGAEEPGSSVSAREGKKHRTRHRVRTRKGRMGFLAGLAMEKQWKEARKVLRWDMMFDIHCVITWVVQFVTIIKGQRCPVGGFNGW